MFKFLSILFLSICAGACTTATTVTNGPNGTPIVAIRCGSVMYTACLERAGQSCPRGYSVITQNESGAVMSNTFGSTYGSYGTAFGSSTTFGARGPTTLVVECK